MRRTARRGWTGPPRLSASEAGFALIEVMVSATLLLILAMGTLAMLEQSVKSSSMNRSRNIAATLAQADQEHMRQLPLSSIAGGYHPSPAVKRVGAIDYTVTSSGDWTRDASGAVTCSADSTGRAEYLTITSSVTWANMGKTKPIVIQSVVAPGVAALGATKGALAIKLKRADGSGTAGINVSSGSVAGVTDNDGCVVLANLDEGTRTASWNQSGYVDPDGEQLVIRPETIGAGTTAQDNGAYDEAAVLRASFVDDNNASVKWPSITVSQTGMVKSGGDKVFPVTTSPAAATVTAGLFPFTSAYGYYAGSCPGNDPMSYGPETAAKAQSETFARGVAVDRSLTLHTVRVKVATASSGVNGVTVKASPSSNTVMANCTEKTQAVLTTAGGGYTDLHLPYGLWTLCAQKGTQFKVAPSVVVNTEDTSGTWAQTTRSPTIPAPNTNGTCP